jgi:V/A-type H+-transporting ATPase subunit K
MSEAKVRFKRKMALSLVVTMALITILSLFSVVKTYAQEQSPQAQAIVLSAERAGVMRFGLMAAAVAFGFGAIGAGFAIAHVGAAAMGAIGEKPEIAGQALIFIALAEGLVVFGFITALMILGSI